MKHRALPGPTVATAAPQPLTLAIYLHLRSTDPVENSLSAAAVAGFNAAAAPYLRTPPRQVQHQGGQATLYELRLEPGAAVELNLVAWKVGLRNAQGQLVLEGPPSITDAVVRQAGDLVEVQERRAVVPGLAFLTTVALTFRSRAGDHVVVPLGEGGSRVVVGVV